MELKFQTFDKINIGDKLTWSSKESDKKLIILRNFKIIYFEKFF